MGDIKIINYVDGRLIRTESDDPVERFLAALERSTQGMSKGALGEVSPSVGTQTPIVSTFDLMNRFLTARRGAGCQDTTIVSYRSVLRPFARSFPAVPTKPEVISGYLASQRKDTTRRLVYRVLCLFYSFVSEAEKLWNPMAKVPKPKVKKEEKEWLTLAEAKLLMDACETDRERALVGCYLNEGLRLSETLGLDVRDVGQDLIWIKHGKERNEPFPLLREVKESLLKLCDGSKPGEPVFKNYRGERLGLDTAEETIKGLFERAGIHKERATPHTLRHTFGSLAVQNGCNQYVVKRLLRHATSGSDVTDAYSHITLDDLRKALETYAPVRLIRWQELGGVGNITGRSEPSAQIPIVTGVRLASSLPNHRQPNLRPQRNCHLRSHRHCHPLVLSS